MKIMLIKPPLTLPKSHKYYARSRARPVGLEYIAAVLEKNGYIVKILDANAENWKKVNERGQGVKYLGLSFTEIAERVKKENVDVIGISILSVDKINAFLVARAIKKLNKNVTIVAGGPHVSAMPQETVSNSNIDIAVVGEGEYTMLEIVMELEKPKPNLQKIKGICYKQNGTVICNEPRPSIKNLDELPFPARHLTNYEKYFEGSTRKDTVITSRGCPFKCIFCSIKLSMGTVWRSRSPENVVAEIEELVEKYRIEHVTFEDDNLTFSKERMHKICDLLISRGLNKKVSWSTPNGVRADKLDRGLLEKMKKSGCTRIIIAPESGSQWVLDNIIHKNLDLKKVMETVRVCKEIGLRCDCFFVMGFPSETKKQVEETLMFMKKIERLGGHPYPPFIAQPYYGTELYRIAREKGYLIKKDGEELELEFVKGGASIKTPDLNPEYLLNIQRRFQRNRVLEKIRIWTLKGLFRLFFSHPRRVLNYVVYLLQKC